MTDLSPATPSDELAAGGSEPIGAPAATGYAAGSDGLPPNPYPGLRPFLFSESEIFFGRGEQVAEMLTRLEAHQFLAVVGASGCGKSSLVRAGLLPALEQGFLATACDQWRFVVMRPGDTPLRNLASELMQVLGPQASPDSASLAADEPDPHRVAMVQAALRSGPKGLVQVVEEARLSEDANVLVLVDQFEELFRFRHRHQPLKDELVEHSMPAERDEAAALVSLLLATAAQRERPIYVVVTMRSDFLGDCAAFHGLPEAINDSQFLTPRMTREQARDAIGEPARLFGGEVEPALLNRILNDIGDDPDQLPLMQHALMRMWRHAEKYRGQPVTIQLADYEKLGGLKEALSRHTDIVLKNLQSDADRRVAEMLFRALCDRSAEQRSTRRLATVAEIAAVAGVTEEAVIRVADAFRRSGRNFLTPAPEVPLTAESTLDISHESLIRQWGTLQTWLEREESSARIYRRLVETARLWKAGQANLYQPPELDIALRWKQDEKPTAEWANRYAPGDFTEAEDFLKLSDQAEAERRAAEKRRRGQQSIDKIRPIFLQIERNTELLIQNVQLHDDLQDIHLALSQIPRDIPLLEANQTDWNRMRSGTSALCVQIEDLLIHAAAVTDELVDVAFVDFFKDLPDELNEAVQSRDARRYAYYLSALSRKLDRALPRVNDRIVQHVTAGRLEDLVQILLVVYEMLSDMEFEGHATDLLNKFRAGIDALTELDQSIRDRADDHYTFQEAEMDFQQMIRSGEPTYSDISIHWSRVGNWVPKLKLVDQYERLLKSFDKVCQLLSDEQRIKDDEFEEAVKWSFDGFVLETRKAFNKLTIDLSNTFTKLKPLGDELQEIFSRLQSVDAYSNHRADEQQSERGQEESRAQSELRRSGAHEA